MWFCHSQWKSLTSECSPEFEIINGPIGRNNTEMQWNLCFSFESNQTVLNCGVSQTNVVKRQNATSSPHNNVKNNLKTIRLQRAQTDIEHKATNSRHRANGHMSSGIPFYGRPKPASRSHIERALTTWAQKHRTNAVKLSKCERANCVCRLWIKTISSNHDESFPTALPFESGRLRAVLYVMYGDSFLPTIVWSRRWLACVRRGESSHLHMAFTANWKRVCPSGYRRHDHFVGKLCRICGGTRDFVTRAESQRRKD